MRLRTSLVCASLLACGPTRSDPSGDGSGGSDGGDGTTSTAASGVSVSESTATHDTTTSADSTTGAPSCAVAPTFTTRVFGSTTSDIRYAVGELDGDDRVDLLLIDDWGPRVLFGQPGGWDDEGATLELSIDVPSPTTALALADVADTSALDLVAIHSMNEVTVWLGDGAGDFSTPASIVLPAESVSSSDLFDIDGDGRAELVVGTLDGQVIVVGLGDAVPTVRAFASGFDGVDALVVAPYSAIDPTPTLFVAGWGTAFHGLQWAPAAAETPTWTQVGAAFTHYGDMIVDDVDGDGVSRWVGVEGLEGAAPAIRASLLESDSLSSYQSVELDDVGFDPGVAPLDDPGGYDVVAVDGHHLVLVDFDCGAREVFGEPVLGRLQTIDVDGDGRLDVIASGGHWVIVLTSAD